MQNTIAPIFAATLLAASVALACPGKSGGECGDCGCGSVGATDGQAALSLTDADVAALREALADERKAIAWYEAVLAKYPDRRPFANIFEAERRHAAAILNLFERAGVRDTKPTTQPSVAPVPDTFAEACRLAAEAEVENAEMYDRLLKKITSPEAERVMKNLQRASVERHLPAFRRAAEGGGRRGAGRGR